MEFIKLKDLSSEAYYECFSDAFSDYVGFRHVPYQDFMNMMKVRGMDPEISYAAKIDGQLAGVIMNAYKQNDEANIGYVVSIGVRPKFRGQKVAQSLILHSIHTFKNMKIHSYMLEVITINEKAYNLYTKLGFKKQRDFPCFKINKIDKKYKVYPIEKVDKIDYNDVKDLMDVMPSWQNSFSSLNRNPGQFTYLVVKDNDKIIGYAISDLNKRSLLQIAVHKNYRRQGIGSSLLNELFTLSNGTQLGILNVDETSISLIEFFKHFKAEELLKQFELVKVLE
ncbi:GNAT family N-acetyltransferase [Acholeplasma hippikon]|uniref:Ribosomal-protein-alanine N-acetyltransferase n=1 Tax=Acholeplasma hippikon TaxID=264636 RepID=A0A449BIH9_9MOLU|nr:GNAT family N-acetyltransferase [Acholeplasma hippikon]VEU82259.1 ribosomal-protein-alanine N-acetyltransferase [Acholeplasma hippikon]